MVKRYTQDDLNKIWKDLQQGAYKDLYGHVPSCLVDDAAEQIIAIPAEDRLSIDTLRRKPGNDWEAVPAGWSELTVGSSAMQYQPISIVCRYPEIVDVCGRVQRQLASANVLSGVEITVNVRDSFSEIAIERDLKSLAKNGAYYKPSERAIYVNRKVFLGYSERVQEAVLAHEIGHAFAEINKNSPEVSKYFDEDYNYSGDEILADRLACIWGYEKGIFEMRQDSGHPKYVEALSIWKDETAYISEMNRVYWLILIARD